MSNKIAIFLLFQFLFIYLFISKLADYERLQKINKFQFPIVLSKGENLEFHSWPFVELTKLKVPKCEILISWIVMIFISWSLYR